MVSMAACILNMIKKNCLLDSAVYVLQLWLWIGGIAVRAELLIQECSEHGRMQMTTQNMRLPLFTTHPSA